MKNAWQIIRETLVAHVDKEFPDVPDRETILLAVLQCDSVVREEIVRGIRAYLSSIEEDV